MAKQNVLNLLKPNLKNGFLSAGKGQEISYLELSASLNENALSEDVSCGAKQYEELLEFSKKRPSRFVVIDCESEEEGLMAASYLAGIYNERDGITESEDEYNLDIEDEENVEFEDYFYDPLGLDEEDDEWEEDSEWNEDPWKMPVIDLMQIVNQDQSGFNPFTSGDMRFMSTSSPKSRLPYWYYTRTEPICIVNKGIGYMGPNFNFVRVVRRFTKNRHVYILNVHDTRGFFPTFDSDDMSYEQQLMCELILEYSAGAVKVKMVEADRDVYHCTLFDNWISHFGRTLEKGFPREKVVKKITAMKNPAKSELMEKVMQYILKDETVGMTLTESDFNILDKFKALGVFDKDEKKTIEKLDTNLIGMDAVKEQMKGIVEIMRYNKKRESMGLCKGSYHNVHMLLGAPGTAKTTVAQMLGNIMAEEKLLGANRFISVNGAELKGMYVGHSAPKVKALFDNYDIILIDEAYAVAAGTDGDTDSFSQESIAQLIIELEKHGMDRLVMFAGYGGAKMNERDNKMKKFLQANPGIRSRINSTIMFESYTPEQMVDIFYCHAKQNQYKADPKAADIIRKYFEERVKDNDFGNGREARSLLENTTMEAAKRLAKVPDGKLTKKMLSELKIIDVERAIEKSKQGIQAQKAEKCGANCGFAV